MPVNVILDTNFLMIPAQFRVDIFEEIKRIMVDPYQLCIFEATVTELKKVSEGHGKHSTAAKIALILIKQKNLKILKNSLTTGYVDELILNEKNAIICTQDAELKKQLKKKHVKIITLKSREYLVFT